LAHYADLRLKGYGFICFEESDDGEASAAEAIIAFNNTCIRKLVENEISENENRDENVNTLNNNNGNGNKNIHIHIHMNMNMNMNMNINVNTNIDDLNKNNNEISNISTLLITCNFGKRQTNHSKVAHKFDCYFANKTKKQFDD